MKRKIEEALDILEDNFDPVEGHEGDAHIAEVIAGARKEIDNFLSFGQGGASFTEAQYLALEYENVSLRARLAALGVTKR